MSAVRPPAARLGGRGRAGMRRAIRWALAVMAAGLPLAAVAAGGAAAAQTSVAPVLSCPGGMTLDSSSGRCLTPRTQTALRPSSCPAGYALVPGLYGGHVCQTKVTKTVSTGRTRQVYSHSTYDKVWVPTGTEKVQTGTNRVWVPSRSTVEPLVPPVRVKTGTTRRCDFDPISGQHHNCRDVPQYGYRTSQTVTIPGYWREDPVYETRETGYWDRVETRHYTTQPVYETVVEWVTSAATQGPCPAGWQPAGSQCSRTVLGEPSAAPTQSCPSGSVPRYGDSFDGTLTSALTCQSGVPGSDTDTGTEQDDSGGPDDSPDGSARPLHHLAGESDERLAELGIHRCANGLLSYVPCDELPGRTWDSDPDHCEGIDGTTYRSDHGGTCVTESDLLNKCTVPGDCEETTIRTYCPAIGQLSGTQIQQHVHPHRGAETYRVCIFDCSSFGTLPPYVQTRINGSYDYACLPAPEDEPTPTTTTAPDDDPPDTTGPRATATTQPGTTATTQPGITATTQPGITATTQPGITATTQPGITATTQPGTTEPTPTTTAPPTDDCAPTPPTAVAVRALGGLGWRSNVRPADVGQSPQRHLPGGGRFLQVAPGRGWAELRSSADVSDGECQWTVAWVRASWADQRPWVAAERRAMEAGAGTRHLVRRWDALDAGQQSLVRRWHRPGAVPAQVACTAGDASGLSASASCGWVLARPGAYAWQASACFALVTSSVTPHLGVEPAGDDPCWVQLASGLDWIRSVGDYADGRVTLARSGGAS